MHFCKPKSEKKDLIRDTERMFLKQDIEDYCNNQLSYLTDGKRGELKRRAIYLGVDFKCPRCEGVL